MNKRIYNKIFHRANNKVRQKKPLTTLELKVWKKRQDLFLRICMPIIQEIKEEEQANDWINYTETPEFHRGCEA